MSSKVYFIRVADGESAESLAEKAAKVYVRAKFASQLEKNRLVAIKQHFGEKGGDGFLKPPITKRFVELVKKTGAKPFLTDTSTLYKGNRGTAVDYLNLCAVHGFTQETMGCPLIMADGLVGASHVFVEIAGTHYKRVPIAADAFHTFAFVVLTHVTGHVGGGMGASIKNVGMGLSSRAGKLDQHHGDAPIVTKAKCTACGTCAEFCPVDAITVDEVAVIDGAKCISCGECMTVCPADAIGFKWGESNTRLNEKMAEHALAVRKTHPGRMCFFNFITHVTKECDCFGIQQDAGCADIGITASDDIVAVDQATVDIMRRELGRDLLKEFHPELEYESQMTYGEKIGLGSRQYDLIEV
ncbi:MAG TPA: DUF362 domain-containing protein [Planctomycetota bacterium]|nr:DUF362 domain-containing protein [Planctomycetota bacterium]